MRRSLMILVFACVLATLVLPATASASTWVVRSTSGTKMGTVATAGSRKCNVFDPSGVKWGTISWLADENNYVAGMWLDGDTGLEKFARLKPSGSAWSISPEFPYAYGRAAKRNHHWMVTTTSNGRVRGRMALSCPGWVAAGAVFILSTDWSKRSEY